MAPHSSTLLCTRTDPAVKAVISARDRDATYCVLQSWCKNCCEVSISAISTQHLQAGGLISGVRCEAAAQCDGKLTHPYRYSELMLLVALQAQKTQNHQLNYLGFCRNSDTFNLRENSFFLFFFSKRLMAEFFTFKCWKKSEIYMFLTFWFSFFLIIKFQIFCLLPQHKKGEC